MKPKTITILFFSALVLYFAGHYIGYGSLTNNCVYTEKQLPVPEQLSRGEIVIQKDAYVAIGHDAEYSCLKDFGKIDKEIVDPASVNNPSVGRRYYTSRGLSLESLKRGEVFRVVGVVLVNKHGISTMDSGGGPIDYLILRDKNNALYQIATVSFGINDSDVFASFSSSSPSAYQSVRKMLSADSFDRTYAGQTGHNPFVFTEKFVDMPVFSR